MNTMTLVRIIGPACLLLMTLNSAFANDITAEIIIPRIDRKITIDDFVEMIPGRELEGKLAVVDGFIQSNPKDGSPASQKTVVYLAYDKDNLYVIFVCFDNDPQKITTAMTRREGFGEDEDWIEIYLDTYSDQRRSYCFSANALGIQWDSRYSEATGYSSFEGHQPSFDALWYSDGRLTDKGYIVWMSIPFKSLRFPSGAVQKWRTLMGRSIPRNNEYSAWPHVSRNVQGMLTQSSILNGLENVAPGKNIQFIPYSSFRSFRLLDADASPPEFIRDKSDPSVGLDSKLVLRDSYVLDFTLNPDFSQIESDEPQVTVNERFEVFFREKRPFFLENAQYFEGPLNLVFTRRIADPEFGSRLTGKYGPFTMGFLFANDESPGKLVPQENALFGSDAYFGIFRATADIFAQSSIGALFTTRTFENNSNHVGGADFRFRLGDHWQASGQAVGSWTSVPEGASLTGHAYQGYLIRSSRQFRFETIYNDLSPEFRTFTGFIPRVDYRSLENNTIYQFRPEGDVLVAWGPELNLFGAWDSEGTRLDSSLHPALFIELQRRTFIRTHYFWSRERIRPVDFDGLSENIDFATPKWSFDLETSYFRWATIEFNYTQGKDINFVPAAGQLPDISNYSSAETTWVIRPLQRLQLRNSYLFTALKSPDGPTIFNDHIISVRSNYQFTKELSLRLILQYESTLVNAEFTSLDDRRNLNADVLVTYLVNPWTALYVGYNGNRQNYLFIEDVNGPRVIRDRGSMLNDANQFFMKFSYLFRF